MPKVSVWFISIIVFLSGFINIASAIWAKSLPRLDLLHQYLPIEITNASRTATLLGGFILIYLSWGLIRRKHRAWLFSLFILITSLFLHLLKGLDYEETIFISIIVGLLIYYRHEFTVLSGRSNTYSAILKSLLVLIVLFAYATLGFFALQGQYREFVTWRSIWAEYRYNLTGLDKDTLIPITKRAAWFDESISVVGIFALALILLALFYPYIDKSTPSDQMTEQVKNLQKHFGFNSSSYFALMADKQYFIDSQNGNALAYRVANSTAVVLGDPLGDSQTYTTCLINFIDRMSNFGLEPAFYNIDARFLPLYRSLGFASVKVGEEAVIDTAKFSLAGPRMANIRHAVSHLERIGARYQWTEIPNLTYRQQLGIDRLHSQWLKSKKMSALTFSLDFYPFPLDAAAIIFLAFSPANDLWGAFSLYPYSQQRSLVLDSMLRNPDSPNGLVETAITQAIIQADKYGYQSVSLGTAPLANLDPNDSSLLDKSIKLMFDRFNQFYGYKSLFRFKAKFNPAWQSKYLAYRNTAVLPKVTLAVVQAHLKSV